MWNLKKKSKSMYISTQIVEENALFSGNMYTVDKYFPHDRPSLQISLLRKCSEIGRIKKQYGVPAGVRRFEYVLSGTKSRQLRSGDMCIKWRT